MVIFRSIQGKRSNAKVSDGSQPAMTLVFHSERNGWLPFDGPPGWAFAVHVLLGGWGFFF